MAPVMIGVDPHKASHTAVGIRSVVWLTVPARRLAAADSGYPQPGSAMSWLAGCHLALPAR